MDSNPPLSEGSDLLAMARPSPMWQSADPLDQELTPQKKVEKFALPSFEAEAPLGDGKCMGLSTEQILDTSYFESPPVPPLSGIDPFSFFPYFPYPVESNPDQTWSPNDSLVAVGNRSGFRRMSDEEWACVEPLMCENTKIKRPRSALNSVFLMLVKKSSGRALPLNPDLTTRSSAYRFFRLSKENGLLEEVLVRLSKETQGASQLYYQNLLRILQKETLFLRNQPLIPIAKNKFINLIIRIV